MELAVRGTPVGAILVAPKQVQPVRQALNAAGLGSCKPVTRYHEPAPPAPEVHCRRMAVHVSSSAAAAITASVAASASPAAAAPVAVDAPAVAATLAVEPPPLVPPLLAELLAGGQAEWAPGLRVGSSRCI